MQDIAAKFAQSRRYFLSGKTKNLNERIALLKKLKHAVIFQEKRIFDALASDFGKDAFDSYTTEVLLVLEEIDDAIKCLPDWARPQRTGAGLINLGAQGVVYRQPLGVVLILSPWNYPFMLALSPLVGAVAAGNCVILKPSSQTSHTAAIVTEILSGVFAPEQVLSLPGGHELADELLDLPFDQIFFTGSPGVGKTVMEKASRHLTPVVLELGGKSPCIVDRTADLRAASRRIVWGKFLNAGQTCVAPDYLLVERTVLNDLLALMSQDVKRFYYPHGALSPEFPRIINTRHYDRLMGLMKSGKTYLGGKGDESSLKIEPTILTGVAPQSPVMSEEIFGPILPVLPFDRIGEAIAFVKGRPSPLALYLFTASRQTARLVLEHTASGGGCINDTVMHVSSSKLPFGGVGQSGMGKYHGKYSFETFTNQRCILEKPACFELPFKYPPHGKMKTNLIRWIMK